MATPAGTSELGSESILPEIDCARFEVRDRRKRSPWNGLILESGAGPIVLGFSQALFPGNLLSGRSILYPGGMAVYDFSSWRAKDKRIKNLERSGDQVLRGELSSLQSLS